MRGFREIATLQTAKRESQRTTELAADGLVETTGMIGRITDTDATTTKRRVTEGREKMETKTDGGGTEILKMQRWGPTWNVCPETLRDERIEANSTSHGLGGTRFRTKETTARKPQPNNVTGVKKGDREEAQSGIDLRRQSRILNGWIRLSPVNLRKLIRKKSFSVGKKAWKLERKDTRGQLKSKRRCLGQRSRS
jgi:hypothetical protein